MKPPAPLPVDPTALKQRALDRWENEGGEIPGVRRSETAANPAIEPRNAGNVSRQTLMPTISNKPGRKTSTAGRKIAAKAKNSAVSLTAQRFAATGRTTRVQGHVSAHNKRTQGKRDAR